MDNNHSSANGDDKTLSECHPTGIHKNGVRKSKSPGSVYSPVATTLPPLEVEWTEEPAVSSMLEIPPGQVVGTRPQGHLCCGCCCDMRRAVIIVNLISLGLSVPYFRAIVIGTLLSLLVRNRSDNDTAAENMSYDGDQTSEPSLMYILFLPLLYAAGYLLGLLGAVRFNVHMVAVAAVLLVTIVIHSLVHYNFVLWILPALFLYPHVCFIHQFYQGTMTKENYPNEMKACC